MSSFPGLNDPFLALSLAAISPGLKGVLIGGPSGTGKTVMARAARTLFPKNCPFVNVPLGCTIDRLVGGVDLDRSRQTGRLMASPGLLAQANGGVLYIDEINLLPPELASVVLQALTDEEVNLEREGLSQAFPTKFTLVGTFNPEERPLSKAFTDRLAFAVYAKTINHLGWRMLVAARASRKLEMPPDVVARTKRGREIYPEVQITTGQMEELCKFAQMMGIQGNRLDIFAVRCAKANAALHLRVPVTQSDLDLAKRLIYMSRVGENPLPFDDELESAHRSDKSHRRKENKTGSKQPTDKPEDKGGDKPTDKTKPSQQEGRSKENRTLNQDIIPENEVAEMNFLMPSFDGKKGRARMSGKHQTALNDQRGRHVRSVPGHPSKGRVDLIATLKSAAIFHATMPGNKNKVIKIRKEDFHIKQFHQRSGLLFIFAVDGSGSMAINHFEAAKGAALSLLEKAYVFRDKVAMVYFRHKEAQLLVKPGSSLSSAAQALSKVRAGGKTPVTHALLKTLDLAKKANANREVPGAVLILFTDGKANQPFHEVEGTPPEKIARNELMPLCQQLKDTLTACIMFDTRIGKAENPYGRELASWLGAHYLRLRKAGAANVVNQVNEEVQHLRK
ncbi:MAG: AAA family ATPase [Cyclobacteriaceae bacterium]|nr:AAA family ATPase [Cyclobacteriaceae bacterium]